MSEKAPKRKKSGFEKRKQRAEKENFINKLAKLTNYFAVGSASGKM